jgi:hypothetical protein
MHKKSFSKYEYFHKTCVVYVLLSLGMFFLAYTTEKISGWYFVLGGAYTLLSIGVLGKMLEMIFLKHNSINIFFIFNLKIILFFIFCYFVSNLSINHIYECLAGFFCFVPSAFWLGLEQRNQRAKC